MIKLEIEAQKNLSIEKDEDKNWFFGFKKVGDLIKLTEAKRRF